MSRAVSLKISLYLPLFLQGGGGGVWVEMELKSPTVAGGSHSSMCCYWVCADPWAILVWFLGIYLGRKSRLVLRSFVWGPRLGLQGWVATPCSHLIYHPDLFWFFLYFSLCISLWVQELSDVYPATKLESASLCKLDLLETFLSPGVCCPGLRHLHFLGSGMGKSSYFPIWVFLTPDKYLSSPPTHNNLRLTWSGGAETPTPHTSCPDFSLFYALFSDMQMHFLPFTAGCGIPLITCLPSLLLRSFPLPPSGHMAEGILGKKQIRQ